MNKLFKQMLMLVLCLAPWSTAQAVLTQNQDIDLFISAPPGDSGARPNVLILIDNTANWATPFTAEKNALKSLFSGLDNDQFNVGIMMFTETGSGFTLDSNCENATPKKNNDNVDGGYVRYAVRNMNATNKTNLANCVINGLDVNDDKSNGGKAGLAMYEAYLYFKGLVAPYAGDKVKTGSGYGGVFNSGSPKTYISPIADNCQRNYIIYLSNGPVQDNNSDSQKSNTFLTSAGGDTSAIGISPSGSQDNTADEWARFLANKDLSSTLSGNQFITTYTVDVLPGSTGQGPGWTALLKSMATQGKGNYYSVNDTANLGSVLGNIFDEIKAVNSVFASSTLPISVNTRGTNLNQVYIGMFRPDPDAKPRWVGNLKQYQLGIDAATGNAQLVDYAGTAILNPNTGFVRSTARSFWTRTSSFWSTSNYPVPGSSPQQGIYASTAGAASDNPDGELVEKGASSQMARLQTTRNFFTCTSVGCGSTGALDTFNNTNVSTAALGAVSDTERDSIISWIRGLDEQLNDPVATDKTVRRGLHHGDVIHSRPLIINYNRSGQPSQRDLVTFYGAGDGWLHAVKGGQETLASGEPTDGRELWAFMPSEFLGNARRLYKNDQLLSDTATKPYFFDGLFGYYIKDLNNDGRFESTQNDKVYIYPTARRGGRLMYALDVSDPGATPVKLWNISNATSGYEELGQTWSEPKAIKIPGYADPVLIFGAGYDPAADDLGGVRSMGRGIYLVDAATGAIVRKLQSSASASSCAAPVCQTVTGMDYSIPGSVAVIDQDRDGVAERMYFADTGGNVWRANFSVDGSNLPLVTAYRLASLGGSGSSARRFLSAPDVVFGSNGDPDRILIGSGDREKPFSATIQDMFFVLKDDGTGATSTLSDLTDITDNLIQQGTAAEATTVRAALAASKGWYLRLTGDRTDGALSGEKVVGGAVTQSGTIFFGTNTPAAALQNDTCTSDLGLARLYAIDLFNGSAVLDLDKSGGLNKTDRSATVTGGGLLPTPVVANVQIGTKVYNVVIAGLNVLTLQNTFRTRSKVYWYELKDN